MLALPVATGEEARTALRDVVGDGEYFHVYLPDSSQARALRVQWVIVRWYERIYGKISWEHGIFQTGLKRFCCQLFEIYMALRRGAFRIPLVSSCCAVTLAAG